MLGFCWETKVWFIAMTMRRILFQKHSLLGMITSAYAIMPTGEISLIYSVSDELICDFS